MFPFNSRCSFVSSLDRLFYPGYSKNWDDLLFRGVIQRYLIFGENDGKILDLGAGSGIVEAMNFRGMGPTVCGIDPDPRVLDNPFLDEPGVADGCSIPYPNDSFDLVFADNVLEHLDNPLQVFLETSRVLKPGGVFLFKTPNRWHYVPLIALVSPHWFHALVNRWRGRVTSQFFPTLYRANSQRQIHIYARQSGLLVENLNFIDGRPEYLRFSWPFYLIGIAYERLVSSLAIFAQLRVGIIGVLRKPPV